MAFTFLLLKRSGLNLSFPNIPNITPLISVTTGQTVPLLLSSIALEELALAHIINAEAEKLQFILGTLPTSTTFTPAEVSLSDLLDVNSTVQRTLRDVIKKEMLLEFKFENVLDLIATITPPPTPPVASATFTKINSPTTVLPGGQITYILSVDNGPIPLTNVVVSDATPVGTTFVSATAEIGFAAVTPVVGGTGPITFSAPSLAANANATFTITVMVNPAISPGRVIVNSATLSANELANINVSTNTPVVSPPGI